MSSYVSLQHLLKNPEASIFKTVLAAAARANELAQGAQPLVKSHTKKVTTIALEEFAAGKVYYEEIKSKPKKASS